MKKVRIKQHHKAMLKRHCSQSTKEKVNINKNNNVYNRNNCNVTTYNFG